MKKGPRSYRCLRRMRAQPFETPLPIRVQGTELVYMLRHRLVVALITLSVALATVTNKQTKPAGSSVPDEALATLPFNTMIPRLFGRRRNLHC